MSGPTSFDILTFRVSRTGCQNRRLCISAALLYAEKFFQSPQLLLFASKKCALYAQKSHTEVRDFCQCKLVEVAGVEPASESTLTRPSPGADGYSGGLTPPVPFPDGKPSRASGQVSFMMCGTGKAYRTHIYR